MPVQTHFWLNNQEIQTSERHAMLTLDFLRYNQSLVGTKEGCREGDCGACTVLVGERHNNKTIAYKPVTSCLMPLRELHGKHLVTIEGLNMPNLTPVQKSIIETGASQCGFCTPGIVVSMTGYMMQDDVTLTDDSIKYALSGHLCRCTGYRSLKESGRLVNKTIDKRTGISSLIEQKILPEYFSEIPSHLDKIPQAELNHNGDQPEYFIAGGTDIYVQQGELLPESQVDVLNLYPDMKGISKQGNYLRVGALTTFEEFATHPEILKNIPHIRDNVFLLASWQIRNRATLGGNIINASPIADMTALLLAFEALLVLQEGESRRTVPLINFYKGYKHLDKSSSEILTEILIPTSISSTKTNFEKVSKRKYLDIASVNSAIKIRYGNDMIHNISIAMGGVAPIPFSMQQTCDYLIGKPINLETIRCAFAVAQNEISPISDIRGSAEYKRLLVRQLLIAHFTKLFPDCITVRNFYDSH